MNRKRNLWIFIGIVILLAALVSGFVLMQPLRKISLCEPSKPPKPSRMGTRL